MKAVDTNVLLRYIVHDDSPQFEKAAAFFSTRTAEDPAYISLIVVAELVWVLRQRYRYPREAVRAVLTALLESAEVLFEEEEYLSLLLAQGPEGDIPDHLIARCASRAGCTSTVTFDSIASQIIPSMELLA